MNSQHFLQKAKTSFQTYVTLSEETELTQEVFRLLKMIDQGKKHYELICSTCQEVTCECDHERMGCGSKDNEPILFP